MEELVTLGALTVLLLGVHIAFAVYLYRSLLSERDRNGSAGKAMRGLESVGEPNSVTTNPTPSSGDNGGDESTLSCPTCGVPNDPSFQFCRRCVADISEHSNPQKSTIDRSGS